MPRQPALFGNPKEPVTRDSLLTWFASTNWIDNHVRKRISPLDYAHVDDYIQSVWEEICKIPEDKLLEIWYKGKPKLVNYFKALISNQIHSGSSKTFKENKQWVFDELLLDDNQWRSLEECGETNFTQQFPVINRDKGIDLSQRVRFEYDNSGIVHSEINLFEDDRDIEEE